MMQYKSFFGFIMVIFLFSCKSEYKLILNSPKKIQSNKELTLSVSDKNQKEIDSVHFSIDSKRITGNSLLQKLHIDTYKLGKHTITALVFYKEKSKKIVKPIYFMADNSPAIYTYKIINTYPHDKDAYTQGLEYLDGFLYEGTGRKGHSSIRKVELKTGKVLQQQKLDDAYFGEGISILKNKIYQLTWQSGIGFIYDLKTFKKIKEFKYTKSREGWGLTHNDKKFIKSDGTERIWFLNPETLVEESYIEAYTNKQKVEKLNELEYFNGKIYANVWQKNSILIINPTSGKIEGVVNLNSLKAEMQHEQVLDDADEVLNGIAYDKINNRIFVTGKHWKNLFEIELIKK